ncbi:MAG TPA: LysR family transcriptional regulator [Candidatus Binatia bacterium]
MTLHQLRVFVKVAELQSFTEAAKALRLTQPSVSSLVQDLVGELKYKLFERRGIKVFLTQEGTVFLRRTREALAIIDGTRDEIDEIRGLKKGKISIGGSTLAATSFLPVVVQAFKKQHPGIEVVLKIQRSAMLEKKLLDGELDLAILGAAPRSPLLIGIPYRDEEIVVIAPPKHPLTRRRSVSLELLSREPFITPEKGMRIREMVEQRFIEKRLPFVSVLEVGSEFGARDAIKSAVANGLGIAFFAKSHAAVDVSAGRLKVLKVPELDLKRTLYIVIHKNRQNSPLIQRFSQFLERFRSK